MFALLKKIVNGFRLLYSTPQRIRNIDERLISMERQLHALFDDRFGYEVADGLVSQLGADFWVLHQNKFKRDGFFVEFGAYDGITLSNTLLLEKFGWKGICAEPNEELFKKLCTVRKCITTNDLIAQESGMEYEFVACGPLGTILEHVNDDMHASVRNKYLKKSGSRKIISLSLSDFLEKYKCPHSIDYISIDTEGSEYAILKNFPFDKWDIKRFSIEHNYTKNREKIFDLLTNNGYRRIPRAFDDWYEKVECTNA